MAKALKQIWGIVLGNRLCNRKTNQFPLCCEENSKKQLQSCVKSCKDIETNWEAYWGSTCVTEKTKQVPLCCEEN